MGDIYYEWITGKKESCGMTREEAIIYFKQCNSNIISVCKDENRYDYEKQEIISDCARKTYEANRLALEALEQEPCGKDINVPATDAISRQDVVKAVDKHTNDDGTLDDDITCILEDVPSVTPQPKTGHWIEHPEIETSTPEYLMFYECSECGDKPCFCKSDIHRKHFCNNCGARMVEPQESEE